MVIEVPLAAERTQAGFHGKYVIAHAFGRLIERHTIAAHDMRLHLAAKA